MPRISKKEDKPKIPRAKSKKIVQTEELPLNDNVAAPVVKAAAAPAAPEGAPKPRRTSRRAVSKPAPETREPAAAAPVSAPPHEDIEPEETRLTIPKAPERPVSEEYDDHLEPGEPLDFVPRVVTKPVEEEVRKPQPPPQPEPEEEEEAPVPPPTPEARAKALNISQLQAMSMPELNSVARVTYFRYVEASLAVVREEA